MPAVTIAGPVDLAIGAGAAGSRTYEQRIDPKERESRTLGQAYSGSHPIIGNGNELHVETAVARDVL